MELYDIVVPYVELCVVSAEWVVVAFELTVVNKIGVYAVRAADYQARPRSRRLHILNSGSK
jgi:hypothetical protein